MSNENRSPLDALKNLLDMNDYLNESYKEEFGEDSPYKFDGESEKALRDIMNKIDEDKEK